MRLNTLRPASGSKKSAKRVGRGIGSGRGKTCTRGTKGHFSRSGADKKPGFEGGQMPLYRRLPHRGFNNARFRGVPFAVVNVDLLNQAFEAGESVDLASLREKGLVKKDAKRLKILGNGEISKALKAQRSQQIRADLELNTGVRYTDI